jgi:hypothetical protein
MARGTEEKYREILKRAINNIGISNLLSIEEIGRQNSKVSLDTILDYMGSFGNGLDAVNYLAHYGEYSRLADFVEIGLPEYVIDRLIAFNYLQKRTEEIFIPAQEELLLAALSSLDSKYGKAKVAKLKKRLRIKEVHYR